MRWFMVAALLVVCFGCYELLSSARDLAGDVARTSDEHAATKDVPRILDSTVRVKNGVALLRVRCESEAGCAGTLALALDGVPSATTGYGLAANANADYPFQLPPASRAQHAQVTFTEASGATATSEITLSR